MARELSAAETYRIREEAGANGYRRKRGISMDEVIDRASKRMFGDYEIVPPFPQLGRTMCVLGPDEEYEQALKVKIGTRVPELALLSGLPPLGWVVRPCSVL